MISHIRGRYEDFSRWATGDLEDNGGPEAALCGVSRAEYMTHSFDRLEDDLAVAGKFKSHDYGFYRGKGIRASLFKYSQPNTSRQVKTEEELKPHLFIQKYISNVEDLFLGKSTLRKSLDDEYDSSPACFLEEEFKPPPVRFSEQEHGRPLPSYLFRGMYEVKMLAYKRKPVFTVQTSQDARED